jgi:hypothetical protein
MVLSGPLASIVTKALLGATTPVIARSHAFVETAVSPSYANEVALTNNEKEKRREQKEENNMYLTMCQRTHNYHELHEL